MKKLFRIPPPRPPALPVLKRPPGAANVHALAKRLWGKDCVIGTTRLLDALLLWIEDSEGRTRLQVEAADSRLACRAAYVALRELVQGGDR